MVRHADCTANFYVKNKRKKNHNPLCINHYTTPKNEASSIKNLKEQNCKTLRNCTELQKYLMAEKI